MRDSKAWTIIGLLYGILAVLVFIAAIMSIGCGSYVSPTEPDAVIVGPVITQSTSDDLFASGMNTPLTINQQKGPPRFVCNNSDNPPPWCDDNNWTEDKPPGLHP